MERINGRVHAGTRAQLFPERAKDVALTVKFMMLYWYIMRKRYHGKVLCEGAELSDCTDGEVRRGARRVQRAGDAVDAHEGASR
jgi:hypothetical protein